MTNSEKLIACLNWKLIDFIKDIFIKYEDTGSTCELHVLDIGDKVGGGTIGPMSGLTVYLYQSHQIDKVNPFGHLLNSRRYWESDYQEIRYYLYRDSKRERFADIVPKIQKVFPSEVIID